MTTAEAFLGTEREHTSPADVRAARHSEEDGTLDVAGEAFDSDEPQVFQQGNAVSDWDLRVNTINRMSNEGGSFVRALAHAARMADDTNYEKLKAAFPDYWSKYEAPY